jgi:glutaredoxin
MYVVPKRCPRCRYERQETDTAPEWQCPSCGVAYSKAEGPTAAAKDEAHRPAGRPRSGDSGGLARWIVTALCVVGIYVMFARPWVGTGAERDVAMAEASGEQPEVIMYATTWCGYCKQARKFFERNGISYVEYDVERDRDAWRENRRLGGGGVPTIVVGDDVVRGFSAGQLTELLEPWMN